MAKLTVAGNAYRWAHSAIEQMIRHRPAIAADLLQADAATKHFVAFAIRGWEVRQARAEPALQQLSDELFSQPRAGVLAEIWGVGRGKLGFLKRLPGRVLSRRQYDYLIAAFCDPQRRNVLSQFSRISPAEIEVLALLNKPVPAAASVRTVATIGADLFEYAIAVVRRHRPDLGEAGLASALRELARADGFADWMRNLLRDADLPPPIWDGTAAIVPLRTVDEITAAGLEFRNCLGGADCWLSAVLGRRCFYRIDGPIGPAIASAIRDPVLGAWRVESYRGSANALLKPTAERRLLAGFAAAGIGYYGDYPAARLFDWSDDLLT